MFDHKEAHRINQVLISKGIRSFVARFHILSALMSNTFTFSLTELIGAYLKFKAPVARFAARAREQKKEHHAAFRFVTYALHYFVFGSVDIGQRATRHATCPYGPGVNFIIALAQTGYCHCYCYTTMILAMAQEFDFPNVTACTTRNHIKVSVRYNGAAQDRDVFAFVDAGFAKNDHIVVNAKHMDQPSVMHILGIVQSPQLRVRPFKEKEDIGGSGTESDGSDGSDRSKWECTDPVPNLFWTSFLSIIDTYIRRLPRQDDTPSKYIERLGETIPLLLVVLDVPDAARFQKKQTITRLVNAVEIVSQTAPLTHDERAAVFNEIRKAERQIARPSAVEDLRALREEEAAFVKNTLKKRNVKGMRSAWAPPGSKGPSKRHRRAKTQKWHVNHCDWDDDAPCR